MMVSRIVKCLCRDLLRVSLSPCLLQGRRHDFESKARVFLLFVNVDRKYFRWDQLHYSGPSRSWGTQILAKDGGRTTRQTVWPSTQKRWILLHTSTLFKSFKSSKKKFRSNRACSVLISVGISLLHTAGSNQAPRVPCWGSSRDNRRRVGLIYIHFILSDWKENCPLILDVVILTLLCTVRCSTGTFWNFTEYHLNRPVLIGKSCFLCMGSWNLPVLGSSIHLAVPLVIIHNLN